MDPRATNSPRPEPKGRVPVGAHAALVCLVGAYIGASALAEPVGANIGLALGLLLLGLLGAPWTLVMLLDQQFTVDSAEFVVVAVVGATVNLVLHALVWRWWAARRRRP